MAKRPATSYGKKKNRSKPQRRTPPANAGTHVSRSDVRRRPRQERARETVRAILEATAELAAAEGFAGVSTNRIAERAGVSIGSLYQYFPNKEAIRARLLDAHRERIGEIVERSLLRIEDPAVPFADALRGFFQELVAMHREDPGLIRALDEGHAGHWAQGHGEDEVRAYVQRMENQLRSRARPAFAAPAAAAWVVVQAIEALSKSLAHAAPDELEQSHLVEEAVAMVAGYARISP